MDQRVGRYTYVISWLYEFVSKGHNLNYFNDLRGDPNGVLDDYVVLTRTN